MTPDQITGDAELDSALHKYMDARNDLHRLIREARAAGMTLRHIASIVGLSVETVRKITMSCLVALAAVMLCATATASSSTPVTEANFPTAILTYVAGRPVTAVCTRLPHGYAGFAAVKANRPGNSARVSPEVCRGVRWIRPGANSISVAVDLVALVHEGIHLRGGPDWRDESSVQCRALHEIPRVLRWVDSLGGGHASFPAGALRWIWQHSPAEYRTGTCSGLN